MRNPTLSAILRGGLIAGTCDIVYAFLYYGLRYDAPPSRILRSVASGLLGAEAKSGGAGTAALGLFLHFLIAIIWATIFVLASQRFPRLLRRPVLTGAIYGAMVYELMNLVVLPLSAFPNPISYPWTTPWLTLTTGLLVHMFGIGVPIALAARRYSSSAS